MLGDELSARLVRERLRSGRGSLVQRRELWRYCARGFREWSSLHLIEDGPSLLEKPLTKVQMVEWLRLAEHFPETARDVLRMQREALREGKRVVMRERNPDEESRHRLIELHQYALIGAERELTVAQKALDKAVREKEQFANGAARITHRRRMIVSVETAIAELSDQLRILRGSAQSPKPKGDV